MPAEELRRRHSLQTLTCLNTHPAEAPIGLPCVCLVANWKARRRAPVSAARRSAVPGRRMDDQIAGAGPKNSLRWEHRRSRRVQPPM